VRPRIPGRCTDEPRRADRLIYATAVENDLRLVSKDRAIRDHPHPRPMAVW
jgi:PIN domain nuclease of toxin-antitoxin system